MKEFFKMVMMVSVGIPALLLALFGPIMLYITYVPREIFGSEAIGSTAFLCFGFFWLGVVFATLATVIDKYLYA
tara:strand:- start:474 stop:695 length:222 start_codon:yes stop_codon:yes gene_type:complete